MFEHVDEKKMKYVCNKILENSAIKMSNSKIWTSFLDCQLNEFVIEYNFNFFEVANRFHDFIAFPYKYDFSEEEIRRHWSFLHACRHLGIEIDDEYYDKLKANAKEEEKENKLKAEEVFDLEREKRNMDKYKAERYNLIDMGENTSNIRDTDMYNLETDNPFDQNLKNDEHFEKCLENINLKKIENITKADNDIEDRIINKNEKEMEVDTSLVKNDEKKKFVITKEIEKNKKDNTDSLVLKSIDAVNETIKKENNHKLDKLTGFDDDDVINALFNVAQKISKEEDLPKNLTIDGKDYILPEPKEEEMFPINTNFLPNLKLTEEERIDYREKMISDFNNEGIDKEIEKTKNFDDLIKEDESLKIQYDNLNTYFKFAVRSIKYFVPKINKNLNNSDKGKKEHKGNSKLSFILKFIL